MFGRQPPAARWKPPSVSGDERTLHTFGPADRPVSRQARWSGQELLVEAEDAGSIALFDLPLPGCEHCRITFRCTLQSDALPAAVYPELWCRLPEHGLFFSRGVDRKLSGRSEGTELELPFYLESGQRADLLHLNLVFEGAGAVRVRDLKVCIVELSE